jgi:hypothetical protein
LESRHRQNGVLIFYGFETQTAAWRVRTKALDAGSRWLDENDETFQFVTDKDNAPTRGEKGLNGRWILSDLVIVGWVVGFGIKLFIGLGLIAWLSASPKRMGATWMRKQHGVNKGHIRHEYRQASLPENIHKGRGGNDLEKRIDTIEKALPDIRDRLSRVETKLDGIKEQMVTKADLIATRADFREDTSGLRLEISNFRTDMQSMETRVLKWFVGTAGVLSAIAFGVARLVH